MSLAGDPNVPCGEVTFKAQITSKHAAEEAQRLWQEAAATAAAISDDSDQTEDRPPAAVCM